MGAGTTAAIFALAWTLARTLALTATPSSVFLQEGDLCMTPDNQTGVCRLLEDCPALEALLMARPQQEQNINYLNSGRCGFKKDDPILCCPGKWPPTQLLTQPPAQPPAQLPAQLPTHPPAQPPTQPPVQPPTQPPAQPPVQPPMLSPQRPPSDGADDYLDGTEASDDSHPNLGLLLSDYCSPHERNGLPGLEANLFEHRYMARLGYQDRNNPSADLVYRCGGTLISSRYVLTAAHCVSNLPEHLQLVGVRLGEHTTDTDVDCSESDCMPLPLDFEVQETVVHPSYNPKRMFNDIALVRLRGTVDFRKEAVRPLCLPFGAENEEIAFDKMQPVAAGWGVDITSTDEGSRVLLNEGVPFVSLEECGQRYEQMGETVSLTPNHVCAGRVSIRGSCVTDGGGPLLLQMDVAGVPKRVLFGVYSFGCGLGDPPSVYTRAGNYLIWILDAVRP